MKVIGIVLLSTLVSTSPLAAGQRPVEEVVFARALEEVKQELHNAPPLNLAHKRDMIDLPQDAIVVARRTIGGAPDSYRIFVDKHFAKVIAEELLLSYGESGPPTREFEAKTAAGFQVLPLEEFEAGATGYDWRRLNEKYPNVRHVVRLSWPALDKLGTYAVVRYELIGRDRPPSHKGTWQHASFTKFEKRENGTWNRTVSIIGSLWD